MSLEGFQSGTEGSGHSLTPVTFARTGTTASKRLPCAQILTGSEKSCVVLSAGIADTQSHRERNGREAVKRDRCELLAFRSPCHDAVDPNIQNIRGIEKTSPT